MKNILVISGHTDLNDSVANKCILAKLSESLPQAEFSYLDRLYPDFKIDVAVEQEKLVKADIVVFQFPLFWYAIPSLLKRWLEDIFLHNFSHGSNGDKLKGKKVILSLTTGVAASAYSKENLGYTIADFLAPFTATLAMAGMELVDVIHTGGVSFQLRTDPNSLAELKEKAALHADTVTKKLHSL